MADSRKELLIAQGFDGVETGSFHSRPDAEDEADTDADGDACGGGPQRHDALPGKGRADQDHEAVDEKQGDQATGARQGHGFEQELPGDVAVFGADGLAHTDFPGALRDTDEHDVHHTDATDEQPNRTQDDGRERDFVDNVMELLHLLLGGGNGEIVGTAGGNAPTPLEHFADLIDGLFEHTGIRLRAKIDVIGGGINLLHGVEGEEHTAVFFVGAESALSLFQNADDLKGGAINEGVLSDSTTLREEHGRDIFAEEHDFFLVQVVTFADEAALAQSGVGIDDPEIGLHATKVDRRYLASPGANGMRRFPRRSDPAVTLFTAGQDSRRAAASSTVRDLRWRSSRAGGPLWPFFHLLTKAVSAPTCLISSSIFWLKPVISAETSMITLTPRTTPKTVRALRSLCERRVSMAWRRFSL